MDKAEFKSVRVALRLSQTAFGNLIGLSESMVKFTERGFDGNQRDVVVSHRTEMAVWCVIYERRLSSVGDRLLK